MIDILRHMFGMCGEAHPNLIQLLFVGSPIAIAFKYMYCRMRLLFTPNYYCNHDHEKEAKDLI